MKFVGKLLLFSVLIACFARCKKPYNPEITTIDNNYLVIEGMIDSGQDTTYIFLSRTIKLDSLKRRPEAGASVIIESDKNDSYPLNEVDKGKYRALSLNLPFDRKFRLHIRTTEGKEYLSDYVENKKTPPIDSINYEPLISGVQFYASSHDPTNNTRYYRWDFDETWAYHSYQPTNLKYVFASNDIIFRTSDSLINECYKNDRPSNSVYIGSSTKLGADVISKAPIGYIPAVTGKFFSLYSMNVKQYALTSEAYVYWELLKKNTEGLGSIFDASPSSSISNFHSVDNPQEPVLGYLSVSTVTEKRVFVQGRDLKFFVTYYYGPPAELCDPLKNPKKIFFEPRATYDDRMRRTFAKGDSLPTFVESRKPDGIQVGWNYSAKECVDCRLFGGHTKKPAFWPL